MMRILPHVPIFKIAYKSSSKNVVSCRGVMHSIFSRGHELGGGGVISYTMK